MPLLESSKPVELPWVQAFLDVFQAGHQLVKVQPKQVGVGRPGAELASCLAGAVHQSGPEHVACRDPQTCHPPIRPAARLYCFGLQYTYLACGLVMRGGVVTADLSRNLGRIKQQVRMAPWNEDGFKAGICSRPPVGVHRRLHLLRVRLPAATASACTAGCCHGACALQVRGWPAHSS